MAPPLKIFCENGIFLTGTYTVGQVVGGLGGLRPPNPPTTCPLLHNF
jgi:hypothetical protein